MSNRLLSISVRCYQGLLWAYPSYFRRRFGKEMVQVFHTNCQTVYRESKMYGVLKLWAQTLLDLGLTVVQEQVSNLIGGYEMNDTTAFDRQLGDIIWMVTVALRSGYSLPQAIDSLSQETTEPACSIFKQVHKDLQRGLTLDEALTKLKKVVPSTHLAEVLVVIQEHQKGDNLANLLAPMAERISQQAGSDPGLYAAMRKQAKILGAALPERVKQN